MKSRANMPTVGRVMYGTEDTDHPPREALLLLKPERERVFEALVEGEDTYVPLHRREGC